MGVDVADCEGCRDTLRARDRRADAAASLEISVPGDFSSAAFFLVGALPPARLVCYASPTWRQPHAHRPARRAAARWARDIRLENERTLVSGEPVADLVVRHAPLRGVEVGGDWCRA